MPKAEGKLFAFDSPKVIRSDFLETVPYSGNCQLIEYKTKEFSAVCPFSGLPDIGSITFEYVPQASIVELKSLKYYLVSFRNVGIMQEDATDRIFVDLKAVLKPVYLQVSSTYETRGGIDARCMIVHGRIPKQFIHL